MTATAMSAGRGRMLAMRTIDVAERRARLARRHRLATDHRAADVVEAADSMVCLHATDPASVYLSAWARVDGMAVPDMERALYVDRSLVKHLAMRRTLFVFPRATLSVAQAGASDRVADGERRRLIRHVEKAGCRRTVTAGSRRRANRCWRPSRMDGRPPRRSCATRSPRSRARSPSAKASRGAGHARRSAGADHALRRRAHRARVERRRMDDLATPLGLDGVLARGGDRAAPEADGVAGLVERWLRAFGPGTVADIKWWLGSTVAAMRKALADLDAVEVDLDGQTGYVLPDDLEATAPVEPWAALLPPLDPTTMGWFERDWYLGLVQGAAVRHQRQRRPHRVVGRPDRRRLASDRRPARSSCSCSRTSARAGDVPSRTRRRA